MQNEIQNYTHRGIDGCCFLYRCIVQLKHGVMDVAASNDKRILITAFRNTSAELLVENCDQYCVLLLPNHKTKDGEILCSALTEKSFDYVFCIGQRPNIKNKVHIETTAKKSSESFTTKFNCAALAYKFAQKGIPAKLSDHAGTSYCNALYFAGLSFAEAHELETQVVFIHIPLRKNIDDFLSFRNRFFETIHDYIYERCTENG